MIFKRTTERASLERGYSNAHFSADVTVSASLPNCPHVCTSYDDILDRLLGIMMFGNDAGYPHIRCMFSHVRQFVLANKAADPAQSNTHVRYTLHHANSFTGSALKHLQADDAGWWSRYRKAVEGADYHSPAWSTALVTALAEEISTAKSLP